MGLRLPASASRAERGRLAPLFPSEGMCLPKIAACWPDTERACLAGGIEIPAEVVAAIQRARDDAERDRRTQARVAEIMRSGATPAGFRGRLYPYQLEGALIDRFTSDPGCKVFLSTDAGGTGLNLQMATHLINLDLPWNPAVLRQRLARIHRLGQRESVHAILLIGEESFEQRMEGTLGATALARHRSAGRHRGAAPARPREVIEFIIAKCDNIISMDLLSYLTPSDTRRQLLVLLWRDHIAGDIRQLALLTGAPYAAAYRELARMETAGVVVRAWQGRRSVFSRNAAYPQRQALRRLLGSPAHDEHSRAVLRPVGAPSSLGAPLADDERTRSDLTALGAPLLTAKRAGGGGIGSSRDHVADPAATLAAGLRLARLDPSVARSLPIAIHRCWDTVDARRLAFYARAAGEGQTLGFFLDLTGMLAKRPALRTASRLLRDHRVRRTRDFFVNVQHGRFGRAIADRNTPRVAKTWHFRLNLGYASFEQLFEEFCPR